MSAKELFTKGAKIWVEHPDKVWESATVTSDYRSGVLVVQVDDSGELRQIKIKDEAHMPPLRNPSLLIGQNDLTSLSYLHEPAVLHNLKVRFCDRNAIYTYCGIVLVAINPYKELPIYGPETIMAYRGQAMGDLDPHIFAVAEEAYSKMEQEKKNQSIIVSGESGAGKTISAKYAMRYFADVGGAASETQVEKKVLASMPIMEAIGNAKTTRNDNSSRFGKLLEINFDENRQISGANMRTYLLEKSRVVYQSSGERNYHIFYQLCAAAEHFQELNLDHQDAFCYLNQGGSPNIDDVDDKKTFVETVNALTVLGVSESEQMQIFIILAVILHLGNIRFEDAHSDAEEGVHIDPKDPHLKLICELIGIQKDELLKWLTHRRIASANDVIVTRMDTAKAMFARDALAKHLYGELFAWIVGVVNRALDTKYARKYFIAVLDIYGFEKFEINSFEQFCINYANEKLQQEFNSHVFKFEQEEYIREGISWTMIDFCDNQPCIDLIEDRLGILALLDEECRVPQGSDQGFVSKLHSKCAHYPHFLKPRFQNSAFIIKHYADDVEYQSGGFLEKNRDTVSEEQVQCVRGATACRLVHVLLDQNTDKPSTSQTLPVRKKTAPAYSLTQPGRRASGHKHTVGSQFRASLAALMTTLSSTTTHYVRCIKPNDYKDAFSFESPRVVQQLRACGVLETIRLSSVGYPSRWLYTEFFYRYRLLGPAKDIDRSNIQETCRRIILRRIKDADKYRFGATKLFFRAGQVAYLEKVRAELQLAYCVKVQSCVRRTIARRRYLRIRKAAIGLQTYGRGFLARRKAQEIRRQRSATLIQSHIRGWLVRRKYRRVRASIVLLQAICRGYLMRRALKHAHAIKATTLTAEYRKQMCISLQNSTRTNTFLSKATLLQAICRGYLMRRALKHAHAIKATITIQRYVRGFLARQKAKRMRRQVIVAQAAIRAFLARRQYKRLRIEARSLDHVKKLNKGLENKIISLQQRLEEALNKNRIIEVLQRQNSDWKSKVEALKPVEVEVKQLKTIVLSKEALIQKLESDLETEKEKRLRLEAERRSVLEEHKKQKEMWEAESEKLANELRSNKEHYEMEIEERNQRHESEKASINSELEAERQSRQKLLTVQYELQERIDSLQRLAAKKDLKRSGSDASLYSQTDAHTNNGDDDYASMVSEATSNRSAPEAFNSSAGSIMAQTPVADVSLVLRMNNRLSVLQSELARISKRAMDLEARLASKTTMAASPRWSSDRLKLEELEIENKKLRENLERMRTAAATADGHLVAQEVNDQLNKMQLELDRRRDECIQLKNVLNESVNFKSLRGAGDGDSNETPELSLAYESQKSINQQLQDELTAEKAFYSEHISEANIEIARLRDENNEYKNLLSAEFKKEPAEKAMLFAQNEIAKLAAQCLALQEQVDKLTESCRKYKQQLRQQDDRNQIDFDDGELPALQATTVTRKKEREYLGMFEMRTDDASKISKHLIIDLSPQLTETLLPCLPAYILFMILRHMDHILAEPKMHNLIKSVRTAIKKTLKRNPNHLPYKALWLANVLRLLNNARQYSGDKVYQTHNSVRQNQQCLRNYDLSEYRQVFSDTAVWIYQELINLTQRQLELLIVPAILEHEEISGLFTGRDSSAQKANSAPGPFKLKQELYSIHFQLKTYNVDSAIIVCVFKQLFYFICACSMNLLLLRKDLCCWAKGLQIRYNISHLENWAKEYLAEYGQKNVEAILHQLKPITQVVLLLQARKSMEDVQSIIDMCPNLTAAQVCKILNLYTPVEEYELKVTREVIQEIQKLMQQRSAADPHADKEPHRLLMDTKMIFSVSFPFNPSPIRLEDVELPEVLGLSDVLVKI